MLDPGEAPTGHLPGPHESLKSRNQARSLDNHFYLLTIINGPFDIADRRVALPIISSKTQSTNDDEHVQSILKQVSMIAPGHVYVPEEYGWSRVTFAVGKEALEEGLNRFLASIKEVEVESQGWK